MKKRIWILGMVALMTLCPCCVMRAEAFGADEKEQETLFSDRYAPAEDLKETGEEGMLFSGEEGTYYFNVKEKKEGSGSIFVTGTPKTDADMVIAVTKPGVIGEARCSVSLDGGKTISGEIVSDHEVEFENTGIVVHFFSEETTDEYRTGDKFFVRLKECFPVAGNERSEGIVSAIGHPTDDYEILIEILSDGKPGVSKYRLSYDEGMTYALTDTVPENGRIDLKNGLFILFSPGEYDAQSRYTIKVESNERIVDNTPVYIFVGVMGAIIVVFMNIMLSRKEDLSEYRLKAWKDRQEESAYE